MLDLNDSNFDRRTNRRKAIFQGSPKNKEKQIKLTEERETQFSDR